MTGPEHLIVASDWYRERGDDDTANLLQKIAGGEIYPQKCESLLKRFVKVWREDRYHHETHYRAVAKNHISFYHREMMRILDESRGLYDH